MSSILDPATKKAYEVSYGLFRVADILQSRQFAASLEEEGLELLRATASGLHEEAAQRTRVLACLVSFGKDTGKIHPDNSEVLIQQLGLLESILQNQEIGKPSGSMTFAELNDIFSGSEEVASEADGRDKTSNTGSSAEDREKIILETIKQSGNCRTRDLQGVLPDLSERTIRYDLQRLIEQGKIERHGGGGPASWYRVSGQVNK